MKSSDGLSGDAMGSMRLKVRKAVQASTSMMGFCTKRFDGGRLIVSLLDGTDVECKFE
jgi:hypothetical protein